ncbi:MAG TPA: serine/threonine-protein kinase [Gemmatimonadales bacterium]|nr:serine/threonine-protein kinase [Gemmatimonadales bacterium]
MPQSPDQLFLEFQRVLAGHYSLERELGRGGMGVVYLARDVALDRAVAIKLLPPILAAQPTFRERFLREARTAARLAHPNIVPIHTVQERDGFVYFVMAYVAGRTLGQRVREQGPLRPDEAARILREVAWALGYAHAQGVVHRDVKPDNILLDEPAGRAMVSDFGIAQVAEADPISGAHRAGTRGFMSPEQAEGEPLDGRSDLYALGLVGVYALTGTVVAEGEDAREALAVAPGWLRDAVSRCLEPSPDDRFADAATLGEAIAPQRVATAEVPPVIRIWLTRTQPLVVAATLWTLFTAVGATVMAFRWLSGVSGPGDLIRQLFLMAGPWAVLGVARVFETRRALTAGYELADLRAATAMEAARKREEFAYELAGTNLVGRFARTVSLGSVVLLLGFALLEGTGVIQLGNALTNRIAIGLALTAAATGVVGIVSPGRWYTRDLRSDLSARFWKSRFGAWMVKLAGWGLGRRARAADAMHRATEVLLADELEDLYHGLPAEIRRGLTEVPEMIKRLTASAESLRAQVEAARALGQAADQQQGRMMEAVAALETLRVGLLRLRAGTVSIEGFTTDLDAVREVGDQVDRLLEARREIDQSLPGVRKS